MTLTEDSAAQSTPAQSPDAPGNAVAMIGLVLTMAAVLFCGMLFAAARQLSEHERERLEKAAAASPAAEIANTDTTEAEAVQSARSAEQLRVLLLASVAAVLNLVGLILCVAGLFVPNRPRAMAIGGTIVSALLLIGVFGVMALGTLFRS
jgi:hypothetical protein